MPFFHLGFSIGKKLKTIDFSETIAACDLKVGRYRQLIEKINVCEYTRSRSFLGLGPKLFYISKLKLAFLRNHLAILTKFCM